MFVCEAFESWTDPGFLRLWDLKNETRDSTYWPRASVTVVANGVFDLFHPGHADLLDQAGDYSVTCGETPFLVVALNSDASAARLKGPRRPYYPLADRMRMVALVRGVDAVVGFDEDTPERMLARLRPSYLVKGEEYRGTTVPGAEHCRHLVFARKTPGFSTSEVEQKIVAAHATGGITRESVRQALLAVSPGGA